MLTNRCWKRLVYKRGIAYYLYEGWFLLGILPLYIKRVTVYTR